MSYRDDLEALAHRCEALEKEAGAASKELAEARRMLEQARLRARMPVLDNLQVAAPCRADWNKMVGDDRSRFCGQCEKNVYNLSSMTRAAAEALLIEKEGKLCVRYYQRVDGTILTADCPDGVARRRRRMRIIAASFGAMSAVAAAATALFSRAPLMGAPQRLTATVGDVDAPGNIGVNPEGEGPQNVGVPPERGTEMLGGPRFIEPKVKPPRPHLMGKPSMSPVMGGAAAPPIEHLTPKMGDVAPMMGEPAMTK